MFMPRIEYLHHTVCKTHGYPVAVLLLLALLVGSLGAVAGQANAQQAPDAADTENTSGETAQIFTAYLPFLWRFEPPTVEPTMQVQALPATIPASTAEFSNIVASLLLSDGSTLAQPGETISFTTSRGQFANGQTFFSAQTDELGQAGAQLFASPDLTTASVTVQSSIGEETVEVDFTLADCLDVEPNDLPGEGQEQPSTVCQGNLDGEEPTPVQNVYNDYYVRFLTSGQTITVDLDAIPDDADYDVYLYNFSSLAPPAFYLTASTNSGNDSERISWTHSGDEEKYYVRIVANDDTFLTDSEPNTYRMQLVVEGDGIGPVEVLPVSAAMEELDPPVVQEKPGEDDN